MITRSIALTHRGVLHHTKQTSRDGSPRIAIISGACQTYTDSDEDFKLPVRYEAHGKHRFTITPSNAHEWRLPAQGDRA